MAIIKREVVRDLTGGFKLERLGPVMEPGNPQEIEGVLNPAAVRGPDGALYLFPRLVARGHYSRIGIARVRFNEGGDPIGVELLGIALEPELLDQHSLRAADSLQLAASLIWCEQRPSRRSFICGDQRLAKAAESADSQFSNSHELFPERNITADV